MTPEQEQRLRRSANDLHSQARGRRRRVARALRRLENAVLRVTDMSNGVGGGLQAARQGLEATLKLAEDEIRRQEGRLGAEE